MGQSFSQTYRYNSVDPVEDNSHLIPSDYTWGCRDCGQWDNKMSNKECRNCWRGRSYGVVAEGPLQQGEWRLVVKDRDGNEYWVPRD